MIAPVFSQRAVSPLIEAIAGQVMASLAKREGNAPKPFMGAAYREARRAQIWELCQQGLSNQRIADQIGMPVGSVTKTAAAMRKVGR